MNESAARKTLLIRAYEREGSVHWADADRAWATETAAQVEGEHASIDTFIARRSRLAIERLRRRDKATLRLLKAVSWRRGITYVVFALALIAGLVLDSFGSGAHINLLAPPLLGLLAWNLGVYLLIVIRGIAGLFNRRARGLGPVARALAYIGRGFARPEGKLSRGPAPAFLAAWADASRTLTAARIGYVLHIGAIGYAVGALLGVYLRGIAFEYRVGWESTFLSVEQVEALISTVLGPASFLTGIALPDRFGFEMLRLPDSGGANAAPWLHLYAVTVALVVLLPRLLLALGVWLVERRLVSHFPLSLDDPYYQGLARILRTETVAVVVVPYSVQLTPQSALSTQALLKQLFGPKTLVRFSATISFGGEDDFDPAGVTGGAQVIVPFFSMTATPERENHGAFVRKLVASERNASALALIDSSAFGRQFGTDSKRMTERQDAWRKLLDDADCPAVFVDLEKPDLARAEAHFHSARSAAPQTSAA